MIICVAFFTAWYDLRYPAIRCGHGLDGRSLTYKFVKTTATLTLAITITTQTKQAHTNQLLNTRSTVCIIHLYVIDRPSSLSIAVIVMAMDLLLSKQNRKNT